jgi:hypothetical protein
MQISVLLGNLADLCGYEIRSVGDRVVIENARKWRGLDHGARVVQGLLGRLCLQEGLEKCRALWI